MLKTFVSAAALSTALLAGGAFAQTSTTTMTHVIGGVTVPEGEIAAVQARCAELHAAAATATGDAAATAGTDAMAAGDTETGEPTAADETPAAGASADPAATESGAEEPVAPADPSATGGNMAADSDTTATTTATPVIDLATLTVELCIEGGFTADSTGTM